MRDLQQGRLPIQRTPAGSLAARLAQARAEQASREAQAAQSVRDDKASSLAERPAAGDRGWEQAGGLPPLLPTPAFKRRRRDGDELGEAARCAALERSRALDDELTDEPSPARAGDGAIIGAASGAREALSPRPSRAPVDTGEATPAPAPLSLVGQAPSIGQERWPTDPIHIHAPSPDRHGASGDGAVDAIGEDGPRKAPETSVASGNARYAAPVADPVATEDPGVTGAGASGDGVAELRAQAQQARDEARAARRRAEREREEYTRFARGETIKNIIPLLDDLERALAHVPAHLRGDPWVAGMAMLGESASAMLRREGVERIDPRGEAFDPHKHEAIARVEDDAVGRAGGGDEDAGDEAAGIAEPVEHRVAQVYQPGYILNGRVLRPARVQVVTSRQRSAISTTVTISADGSTPAIGR